MTGYSEEKRHAEDFDRSLGFEIDAIELEIRARLLRESEEKGKVTETWNHLSPQVFQTPYAELERIVAEADPEKTIQVWADLGAAYGRLGIVLARARPDVRFVGIEVVPERVREGKRIFASLGLPSESLICADLTTHPLPEADLYFIYDFGSRAEITQVLEGLRLRAKFAPVRVVGRGRGVRDAIEREHPWLGSVIPPIHSPHYSIYRSS